MSNSLTSGSAMQRQVNPSSSRVVPGSSHRPPRSKAGGYVALVFAALGVYLYASTAAVATGGRALPLGRPLLR